MKNPVLHITLRADPESPDAELLLFKKVVFQLKKAAMTTDQRCRVILPGIEMSLCIQDVNASWDKETVTIRLETGVS